ncbi:MAG: HlyD family efflux transporter periplasmic adaptor subunit [Cyanobacteria bacterium K_DeepCast_35m_m2_023]|nr:HlyD family efflux transporter periplasmic adaptor subunit [Cyanobacteria bacterium K_DeepCast_35m_m2_023]
MAASPTSHGPSPLRRLRRQVARLRLPGAAKLRAGLETITPRSSYEDDFPSRRWPLLLLGTLSGFVGVVLIWSLIARSEISVSSQGRLRPSQAPTRSRAQTSSSSLEVFVKEGDQVNKGQPILQLDDRPLRARLTALQIRYAKGYSQLRETTLLTGLPMPPDLPRPANVDGLDLSVSRTSLESVQTQKEKVAQLKAQLGQSIVKQKSLRQNIALQSLIVKRHEMLKSSGAIAELQVLQHRQRLLDLQADYASNQQEQQRLEAALRESSSEFSGRNNQTYTDQLNELRSTQAEISATQEAIRNSLMRAPLSGYVFRLGVKVPGVPVAPGDEVFQIIPGEKLTASVDVPAAQIGFIHPGMTVDVHIDSYPSSSYGVLKGKVISVGRDSVEPTSPIQAPTYAIPVGVELQQQQLISKGRSYPLKPGMTASVSFNLRSVTVFQRLFDATSSILNPPGR